MNVNPYVMRISMWQVHIDPVIIFIAHFPSSWFMYICLLCVHSESMQSAF